VDYSGGYSPDLIFAQYFNSPTKLCVCIFAFISGWAYALKEIHTLGESFKRIEKFLITYWVVCLPALAFATAFGGYELTIRSVLETIGLTSDVMIFCWYVAFYIVSMLLLPILYRFFDRSLLWSLATGIILPIIIFAGFREVFEDTVLETLFNNLKHWFPCVSVGYVCNRYKLFARMKTVTDKIPAIIVLVLGILICGIGRYYISAFDFIYCAVFVYSVIVFIHKIGDDNLVARILCAFGEASTNMWFLHCLYFSAFTRDAIQPLAYWSGNSILVYMVLVTEVFAVGWLLTKLDKRLLVTLKI